jgi:hypothetical protein
MARRPVRPVPAISAVHDQFDAGHLVRCRAFQQNVVFERAMNDAPRFAGRRIDDTRPSAFGSAAEIKPMRDSVRPSLTRGSHSLRATAQRCNSRMAAQCRRCPAIYSLLVSATDGRAYPTRERPKAARKSPRRFRRRCPGTPFIHLMYVVERRPPSILG